MDEYCYEYCYMIIVMNIVMNIVTNIVTNTVMNIVNLYNDSPKLLCRWMSVCQCVIVSNSMSLFVGVFGSFSAPDRK